MGSRGPSPLRRFVIEASAYLGAAARPRTRRGRQEATRARPGCETDVGSLSRCPSPRKGRRSCRCRERCDVHKKPRMHGNIFCVRQCAQGPCSSQRGQRVTEHDHSQHRFTIHTHVVTRIPGEMHSGEKVLVNSSVTTSPLLRRTEKRETSNAKIGIDGVAQVVEAQVGQKINRTSRKSHTTQIAPPTMHRHRLAVSSSKRAATKARNSATSMQNQSSASTIERKREVQQRTLSSLTGSVEHTCKYTSSIRQLA